MDAPYPGRDSNWTSNQRNTVRITLHCTWRPSGLATGLHRQSHRMAYDMEKLNSSNSQTFCLTDLWSSGLACGKDTETGWINKSWQTERQEVFLLNYRLPSVCSMSSQMTSTGISRSSNPSITLTQTCTSPTYHEYFCAIDSETQVTETIFYSQNSMSIAEHLTHNQHATSSTFCCCPAVK